MRVIFVVACLTALAMSPFDRALAEPKKPPEAAAQRLRKMAADQGHGPAAARALRNLGYEVPWADDENGRALAQRVSVSRAKSAEALVAQLEAALGGRLARSQKDQAGAEFRRVQEGLGQGRRQFAAQASRATRVPLDEILDAVRQDRLGAPLADADLTGGLASRAGRPLNARELRELQAADEARLDDVGRLDLESATRLAKLIGFQAADR